MKVDWRCNPNATLFDLVAAADLLGLELQVHIVPRWWAIQALVDATIRAHVRRGWKAPSRRWP